MLNVGTPAPWFVARTAANPRFHLHVVAGRVMVLAFFGSAGSPLAAQVLQEVLRQGEKFGGRVLFYGVSTDPQDEQLQRVRDQLPGIRFFWDLDGEVTRLYEAADAPCTVVVDERLRIVAVLPMAGDAQEHVGRVLHVAGSLLAAAHQAHAPVLVVPRVFELGLCKALIDYHTQQGGHEGGVMREEGGQTVEVRDHRQKRRTDQLVEDKELRRACLVRIRDRVGPEIEKAFQFHANRLERYMIACYDAADGGHFKPHRDNTTRATAHRRFAVSLLLNPGEYEGGELRFPEFGPDLYTAPAGAAVVFSCSLLHEALPVTRGKRYVFVPFVHDDAAEQVLQENARFLAPRPAGDLDAS